MPMSDYLQDALRRRVFHAAGAEYVTFSALHVSLHTADPTDAGTGTEVSGGSYARVSVPPALANWSAGTSTNGQTANVADTTFPAPSGNWGTVTHLGIWTSSVSGSLLFYGPLTTAKVISTSDPAPKFAAGALTVTFI